MFFVTADKEIHCTRGDAGVFTVTALHNDEPYKFQVGSVLRFKVFQKKDCGCVALQKDFDVVAETESVDIFVSGAETKIGGIINKPVDYWYEVELDPDTSPQTIIGYDEDGPKIFRLYPEGKDNNDD
jgi:hypothetical protein